jgi:hypothetical protein
MSGSLYLSRTLTLTSIIGFATAAFLQVYYTCIFFGLVLAHRAAYFIPQLWNGLPSRYEIIRSLMMIYDGITCATIQILGVENMASPRCDLDYRGNSRWFVLRQKVDIESHPADLIYESS